MSGGNKTNDASGDKALVFQEKIKSSGYSAAPRYEKSIGNLGCISFRVIVLMCLYVFSFYRQGMFQPQINKTKGATPPKNDKDSKSKMATKEYPVTCDPPTKVKVKLDIAERPTSTNTIQFSGN